MDQMCTVMLMLLMHDIYHGGSACVTQNWIAWAVR